MNVSTDLSGWSWLDWRGSRRRSGWRPGTRLVSWSRLGAGLAPQLLRQEEEQEEPSLSPPRSRAWVCPRGGSCLLVPGLDQISPPDWTLSLSPSPSDLSAVSPPSGPSVLSPGTWQDLQDLQDLQGWPQVGEWRGGGRWRAGEGRDPRARRGGGGAWRAGRGREVGREGGSPWRTSAGRSRHCGGRQGPTSSDRLERGQWVRDCQETL